MKPSISPPKSRQSEQLSKSKGRKQTVAWVSKKILEELGNTRVQFFYLHGEAAKLYNAQLEVNSPLAFSGYFWYRSGQEHGPFKSISAARINAYYSLVLHETPPSHFMTNRKVELKLKVLG
jgi:hypothetical protein